MYILPAYQIWSKLVVVVIAPLGWYDMEWIASSSQMLWQSFGIIEILVLCCRCSLFLHLNIEVLWQKFGILSRQEARIGLFSSVAEKRLINWWDQRQPNDRYHIPYAIADSVGKDTCIIYINIYTNCLLLLCFYLQFCWLISEFLRYQTFIAIEWNTILYESIFSLNLDLIGHEKAVRQCCSITGMQCSSCCLIEIHSGTQQLYLRGL